MAKKFTANEAKQLIETHSSWINQLDSVIGYADKQSKAINSIITNPTTSDVFKQYVLHQLATGEEASTLPDDIRQLVVSLYKHIKGLPLHEESNRLSHDTHALIRTAMINLKPGTSGFQWFFTFGKNKELATKAYTYLYEMADGSYAQQIQTLCRKIEQIDHQEKANILQDFEQNKPTYQDALFELSPSVFSRGDTIQEVEQLTQEHQALSKQIEAVQNAAEIMRKRIEDAANLAVAAEAVKLLVDVPIEELGRERTGIRFKALRDYGYTTVADAYCASLYQLASVRGISEDMARTIKQCAKLFAEQTKHDTKLKLSVDQKTDTATRLVKAIYAYRRKSSMLNALNEIKRLHSNTIAHSLNDLRLIGNSVKWVFTTQEDKWPIIRAYQYLKELLEGDYSRNVRALSAALTQPMTVDASTAWDDFANNSIIYFNILEEIVPGLLGNDDSLYGLPEDLAREIQEECFFPDGLKCDLRRYQEWGVKYILHQRRVLLGDEMGLGKTVQAIATMVSLRNTGATHFLVVCPASVLPNWCKEIAEKSKLRVTKIHGQSRMSAFREWLRIGGAGVTTFETTGYLKLKENERFHLLIVDEAHYIKNSEARRTIHVKRLGENTDRMLFMTGTALENKVDEMIALIQILQPTIAAQLHGIAFLSAAPQFRQKVAPVYYRRKREDVLTELPDLIENKEWCTLLADEKNEYERTVFTKRYADIRRVSWNVNDLRHSSKALRMKEIIEEAKADKRKTIVFSFFLDTIRKIRVFLGDCCLEPINGSVPPQRRQEIIDDFDKAPAGTVLLAQIQSGGTGLNIQSASVVILCEPQLKPSIENQAISRAYRLGQARNVLVYRLLCENTIDERITDMLAKKQVVFNAFADQSAAATATAKEEVELDNKTMGVLIQEEIDRINAERATNEASDVPMDDSGSEPENVSA